MSFEFRVPFQSRDQTPAEALAANVDSALEGEDRRIAGAILLDAATDPEIETMGGLIDHIDAADPAERRQLLDRWRRSAGLEAASDIEAEEQGKRNRRLARQRRVRIEQAPPERRPRVVVTPTGGFKLVDPVEIERERPPRGATRRSGRGAPTRARARGGRGPRGAAGPARRARGPGDEVGAPMTTLVEQPSPEAYEEARRVVYRRKILAHEVGHAVAEILWARMIPRRIEVFPYRGCVERDWGALLPPRQRRRPAEDDPCRARGRRRADPDLAAHPGQRR